MMMVWHKPSLCKERAMEKVELPFRKKGEGGGAME